MHFFRVVFACILHYCVSTCHIYLTDHCTTFWILLTFMSIELSSHNCNAIETITKLRIIIIYQLTTPNAARFRPAPTSATTLIVLRFTRSLFGLPNNVRECTIPHNARTICVIKLAVIPNLQLWHWYSQNNLHLTQQCKFCICSKIRNQICGLPRANFNFLSPKTWVLSRALSALFVLSY